MGNSSSTFNVAASTFKTQKLKDGSYTSTLVKNDELMKFYYEDVKTLHEAFLRGIRVSNNGPCLGYRVNDGPYQWLSYQEVFDQARQLGSGLMSQLELKRGDFVAVYSQNRVEWTLTEQAANMYSLVLVPLYDTLGTEACAYIMDQTSSKVCICDNVKKIDYLLSCKLDGDSLRHIVLMDATGLSNDMIDKAKSQNISVHKFSELQQVGQEKLLPLDPPNPEDLATLCYTSGTTGFPKGAKLTHLNLVSNVGAIYSIFNMSDNVDPMNPSDSHLSYLPLAHMFERSVHTACFMHGVQIGFFRGNVTQLMEDMATLRPTMFCTVPRLLNRLYDKVQAKVAGSAIKRKLLDIAVSKKTAMLHRGEIVNNSIWDKLVFSNLHQMTGGRIRLVVTGSAPVSSTVLTFVRAAFGCHVFEGYGQTEANAAVTLTLPGEYGIGHVGSPIPCNKVKLIDVPEMNYLSSNNQGEVAVKGYNVFSGYYKLDDKTSEAFDSDGWLLTGDIGEWLPDGSLKIIDRRKHLFKLAQGEYVAPEKIEQVLTRCSLIAQIFVDGSSLETAVVAVVVPDIETVVLWAKSRKLALTNDLSGWVTNVELRHAIVEQIEQTSRENGLKGFEIPRAVHLCPELFSVENGLLTPTFKSKRPDLRKYFAEEISKMYEEMRVSSSTSK